MERIAWIILGWAAFMATAQAASFDCEKASSKIEKMICGNVDLSKLDEDLSNAYKTALQDEKKSDPTRQAQKKWIKERNNCQDTDCVILAYHNRISELTSNSGSTNSTEFAQSKPMTAPVVQSNTGGILGLENVRDIASSNHKSCAVLKDGNVKCWERADSQNRLTLVDLHRNDVDAIAMAAAGDVLCTVSHDTTVSCSDTPLGNVVFNSLGHADSVKVAVSPSGEFVCVLLGDGRVQCAGNNQYGQLGDGTITSSQMPVFVKDLNDAKAIALGWERACTVLNNGHVKCWGRDLFSDKASKPDEIRGISNVKSLVVGGDYVCVLLQNGTAKCWGANQNGQLGNGVPDSDGLPANVLYLKSAVDLLQSDRGNTCAILRTGGIKCWGVSFGDAIDHASAATDIEGISNATSIAMNSQFLCNIEQNKTVQCSFIDSKIMYNVIGLSDVVKLVGSGEAYMCALLGNGRVKCWDSFHIRDSNVPGTVIFDGEPQ